MHTYKERTTGSWVDEDQVASITWYFGESNLEFGQIQAKELLSQLKVVTIITIPNNNNNHKNENTFKVSPSLPPSLPLSLSLSLSLSVSLSLALFLSSRRRWSIYQWKWYGASVLSAYGTRV